MTQFNTIMVTGDLILNAKTKAVTAQKCYKGLWPLLPPQSGVDLQLWVPTLNTR